MNHTNKAKPLPSAEYLEECMDYNPETGSLFWRERPLSHFEAGKWSAERKCNHWNSMFAGKEAGCVGSHGYRCVKVDGQLYRAHRLAYKLATGLEPALTIDHINGDKLDNRVCNLRDVCMIEQCNNQWTNNDLPRGVSPAPDSDKYLAQPFGIYMGRYETAEEAATVAKDGYEYLAFMRNSGYGLLEGSTGLPSNNTSGYVGVHATKHNTWLAQGKKDGKQVYLGTFKCVHEAGRVAKQWREGLNRHASETPQEAL